MAAFVLSLCSPSPQRKWDDGIPPILRPLVRAYLLGYASSVAPRLLTLLLQHVTRRKQKQTTTAHDAQNGQPFLSSLQHILRGGLDWQRFPTFCAALVGGTTLLELPLKAAFDRSAKGLSEIARRRLTRWLASFIAAWLSLQLLQSKQTPGFTDTVAEPKGVPGAEPKTVRYANDVPGAESKTIRYAGRTLDLTLFAVVRALDVIGGELWHRRKLRRQAARKWTAAEAAISRLTDPAVFALSSGLVMWTWIYLPTRLPRAYNKWIGSAAAVDARLIEALQRCHDRTILYGKDTGHAPLLGSMCADYGMPRAWGDPSRCIPFPCELVHMGAGSSCEYHAVVRFARSFRWALATYLPLNLALVVRHPNPRALRRALLSAARSSAFLGTFITLFYYGVCLTRTRVGPHILGTTPAARQSLDGGCCIGAGCVLCGWSILLEKPARRKDMALFVAPRALATLFPRRYARDKQWRETLVFAASTAVVFTCVLERPQRVRGFFGGMLEGVLGE